MMIFWFFWFFSLLLCIHVFTVEATFMHCKRLCNMSDLCGVLTLQTGYGPIGSMYNHRGVHGLWPQVFPYGDSVCFKPFNISMELPSKVYSCYANPFRTKTQIVEFETHEYLKHGICSGVNSSDMYFNQVCQLSNKPLQLMNSYCIHNEYTKCISILDQYFYINNQYDSTAQVELIACYNYNLKTWNLPLKIKIKDHGSIE